jgi:type VI secretion system protein ImpL
MFKKSLSTTNQTEDALFLVCQKVKQDSSEVVDFLRERLDNTKAFQQMPWYLVLGAKNAGSTQLIAKSELNFLETHRFVELTPEGMETRSGINWWLSSNAVLIDVPGAYLEESTNLTPERAAWFELLTQIRRYRFCRPLNGIILTIDIRSLQKNNIQWMRPRIEEVLHRLKQRLPLYVVITQIDQIQGFYEYYDDLGKNERDQYSGITFSFNEKLKTSWTVAFSENFDKLISNLHQRMLWRVHQECESPKRNKILNFPQQLNYFKDDLKHLIHELSAAKSHASLRGIYFTSSLNNEALAIDAIGDTFEKRFFEKRFASAPTQNVSIAPLRSKHSFFIKTLFEQKIFPESRLANSVLRATASRQDNFLRWGALGFLGIILLSITLTLSQHYKHQKSHLNIANMALSDYKLLILAYNPVTPQLDKLLPALDVLALAEQNASNAKLPWLLRFQLHHQTPLATLTEELYTHDLQFKLIPAVRAQIEDQLQEEDVIDAAQLYGLLKVYLMLGDPLHADKHFLQNWFENWQNPLMKNSNFKKHLSIAINNPMPILPPDAVLVQKTRAILNALPYNTLSNAILSNNLTQTPPLSIKITHNNMGIFLLPLKNISGIYTAREIAQIDSQLNNLLYAAISGNWVLGSKTPENISPETLKTLQNTLINYYVDNYVDIWQEFLSHIRVRKFTSLIQLDQAIQILTQNESPIEQILAIVQQNTQLNTPSALSNKLNISFNMLNNVSLKNIQTTLRGLHTQIREIIHSQDPDAEALEIAQNMANQKGHDAVRALIQQASLSPEPVKTWLLSLANQSRDLILARASYYTWQQWQLQGLPLCHASLENHYPVDKTAVKEVSLADFERFFGNGGIFKQFFNVYLSSFVDTTMAKWKWKNIDGGTFSQNNQILSKFERTNIIQELYFNRKNQLLIPFRLSLNKKNHDYIWPEDTQNITIILHNGKTISAQGNWSIFKLIDQGTLKPHNGGKTYDLIFGKTTYTLNMLPLNPFVPGVINQFKCP